MSIKKTKFDGIFKKGKEFLTLNLVKGQRVYGEKVIKVGGKEFRVWDKWRSKPAAALAKGIKTFPLGKGYNVLYLGLASSTTASHFSDVIGWNGNIFGIDISERVLRQSVMIARKRKNIIPILADARKPNTYAHMICKKIDLLFVDVASPDQIKLAIKNSKKFLEKGSHAMIAIKSQSIDSVRPPEEVYEECLEELRRHFMILDKVKLDPYEKFHLFVVMEKK